MVLLLMVGLAAAPAAELRNAWQVTASPPADGYTGYRTNLTAVQGTAATNQGWRLTVVSRLLDEQDSMPALWMNYNDGSNDQPVYWGAETNGSLYVYSLVLGTIYLTTNGVGFDAYHTHEMRGQDGQVTYYFDGVEVMAWSEGWPAPAAGASVAWGANGLLGGRGQMNFHSVEFRVGSNLVARYHAGVAGNPLVPPDPQVQGWERDGDAGPGVRPVASDDGLLRPAANTLGATAVGLDRARLNGRAGAHGTPTTVWFEWGTTTNYGSTTNLLSIGAGNGTTNVTAVLNGLVRDTPYHYRLVASNSFGRTPGADHYFITGGFTNVPIVGLTGVMLGSSEWGDYDADGRLDFLFTGQEYPDRPSTQLWRNTGSGFSRVPGLPLPRMDRSSATWGDYDNDGRLDVLMMGSATNILLVQLWRNTPSGFTQIPLPGVPALYLGMATWCDYDNDGRLDFLIQGLLPDSVNRHTSLWRNTVAGFTQVSVPGLPQVAYGSQAWGDYDNDGRADLLLTGSRNDTNYVSQLWRNTAGGFVQVPVPGLAPAVRTSVAWQDFDNDGRLDFVITGRTNAYEVHGMMQVWRNTGQGFERIRDPGFPRVYVGSVGWGDYDNDGRSDLLVSGIVFGDPVTQLWRNTGDGFMGKALPGVPGAQRSTVAWGDFDNDRRLDFVLTGATGDETTRYTQVWRSIVAASNSPPGAPAGLAAEVTSPGSVTLSWEPSTDDRTPAAGLSYNVVMGGSSNAVNIVGPHASVTNGFRRVVRSGPVTGTAPGRVTVRFTNLPPATTYYWSVQAIDTAFAGGPFAVSQTFVMDLQPAVITLPPTNVGPSGVVLKGAVNAAGSPTTAWFEWGMTVDYGQATPAVAVGSIQTYTNVSVPLTGLTPAVEYHYRIVGSNVNGVTRGNDVSIQTPAFTNIAGGTLPAMGDGAVAWGDYNNDGRLDLLMSGNTSVGPVTAVWRSFNNGFVQASIPGLASVYSSSVAWADFDNDGRLDFLVAGNTTATNLTQLWRNAGGGFVAVPLPGVPALDFASVAWGDYDSDGRVDFLITGRGTAGMVTQLWRNTGAGFRLVPLEGVPGIYRGCVAWADYDRDGRLDFFLAGRTIYEGRAVSQLWRNTGSGFSRVEIPGLAGLGDAACAWGDHDNDGRLDLIVTGLTDADEVQIRLWRQTDASFVGVPLGPVPGVYLGSVAWGDADNDGRLDLLVTGRTVTGTPVPAVAWRNTTNGFVPLPFAGSTGATEGVATWSDFDNDGRLDILILGQRTDRLGYTTQLWRNQLPVLNQAPSAPTGLAEEVSEVQGIRLSWDAATDDHTPPAGLTYNLMVGSSSNATDLASPAANVTNGFRRIVQAGTAGHGATARLSYTFTNLPPAAAYHWSVQAIDGAAAGGSFAPVRTFSRPPVPEVQTQAALGVTPGGASLTGRIRTFGLPGTAWFEWGDSPGFGRTNDAGPITNLLSFQNASLVVTGLTPGVTYHYRLAGSNANGLGAGAVMSFTAAAVTNVPLPGPTSVAFGTTSWADYNGDGRLDLVIAGWAGTAATIQAWRNTPQGFVAATIPDLPPLFYSDIAWADFDNDGRVDVLMSGANGSSAVTGLWRNTGERFVAYPVPGLPAVFDGAQAWGDFDNDGRADFLLTGSTATNTIAQLWRNTGNGFSRVTVPGLAGAAGGVATWLDYDVDGRLDFFLAGTNRNGAVSQLWRNLGGSFSLAELPTLPEVTSGSAIWGDYDNDGRPDLLVAGSVPYSVIELWRNSATGLVAVPLPGVSAPADGELAWGDVDGDGRIDLLINSLTWDGYRTEIWRNTVTGFHRLPGDPLPAGEYGSVAVADFDNDGRLDFVTMGTDGTGAVRLWRNLLPWTNSPPAAPVTLVASPVGSNGVTLSWSLATDDLTPAAGLTYNVLLATSSNLVNIASPLANRPGGFRQVVRAGPITSRGSATTSITFSNLPPATNYYWSVQAIDSSFAGGPFAPLQTFQPAGPPRAVTLAATATSADSAVLRGRIHPGSSPTVAWFEWGGTTNYARSTVSTAVGGGAEWVEVEAPLVGLSPASVYYYRLVASNQFGVATGTHEHLTTPAFASVAVPGLAPVSDGVTAWGDFDNDGWLDFLLAGRAGPDRVIHLWRNTGDGFVRAGLPGVPGVEYGALAWSDFDGDGRLDFLLTGLADHGPFSGLWRNSGGGFIREPVPGLPEVYAGAVAWGDYDSDGRPDFLISGLLGDESTRIAQLWRNTGRGFRQVPVEGLPGVAYGSIGWSDYDRDGRLDFLLTGLGSGPGIPVSQLWRNTGSGFQQVPVPGLPGVSLGSVAWGDPDQDGWPDFVITGLTNVNGTAQIWRNTGGAFSFLAGTSLPGLHSGGAVWGDFDADGWPDLLLAGRTPLGPVTQLWHNDGAGGTWSPRPLAGQPGLWGASVAVADHDRDGRLDYLITGFDDTAARTILWRNIQGGSNQPPAAPTGLAARLTPRGVEFMWLPATDSETAAAGLTYNLRISGPDSSPIIVSPLALPDGTRLVPARGTVGPGREWTLGSRALSTGDYHWSVQSIDSGFAGSRFSTNGLFRIQQPVVTRLERRPDGALRLEFNGTTPVYHIEAVTDWPVDGRTEWLPLGDATELAPGRYEFIDTGATNLSGRFYRIVWP